jgi:hypothetical protein
MLDGESDGQSGGTFTAGRSIVESTALHSTQRHPLSSSYSWSRNGIHRYRGRPLSYEQTHMLSGAWIGEEERQECSATNAHTSLLAGKRAKRPATI